MPTPIVSRRLGDMCDRSTLHAYCRRCDHTVELDRALLIAQHGDLLIDDLQGRLRCSGCGARDVGLLRGWNAQLGYRHAPGTKKGPGPESGADRVPKEPEPQG